MSDTPTPSQAAEKAEMPVRWKFGDEFAPYHPQASHCNPDYRDGWNHCYRAAEAQLAEMRAEVERLKSVIAEHNAECISQCEARKAAGTTQCPMKGYRRNCSDCPRDGMVDAALAADGKDGAR